MLIKKLAFLLTVIFGLISCATSYNSLSDTQSGGMQIIEAAEPEILSAAYEAITSEFPSANINEINSYQSGFTWFHQPMLDRTTFRLVLNNVVGVTPSGDEVDGFTVSITTSGSQGFVDSRYVTRV